MSTFHYKCCGFIGQEPCPYKGSDKSRSRCRIHTNGLYTIRVRRKLEVVQNKTCTVCCENRKCFPFKCGRHAYCHDCIIEQDVLDGVFDDCPFCVSAMEMLD